MACAGFVRLNTAGDAPPRTVGSRARTVRGKGYSLSSPPLHANGVFWAASLIQRAGLLPISIMNFASHSMENNRLSPSPLHCSTLNGTWEHSGSIFRARTSLFNALLSPHQSAPESQARFEAGLFINTAPSTARRPT